MDRAVRWSAAVLLLFATAVAALAGYQGSGPLARLWVTERRIDPQSVAVVDGTLTVSVAVPWTEEGYCDGQFEATATETPTEVRFGPVVSREHPGQFCSGLGTAENLAWTDVQLTAPLGTRTPVRASDGAPLPVRRP